MHASFLSPILSSFLLSFHSIFLHFVHPPFLYSIYPSFLTSFHLSFLSSFLNCTSNLGSCNYCFQIIKHKSFNVSVLTACTQRQQTTLFSSFFPVDQLLFLCRKFPLSTFKTCQTRLNCIRQFG